MDLTMQMIHVCKDPLRLVVSVNFDLVGSSLKLLQIRVSVAELEMLGLVGSRFGGVARSGLKGVNVSRWLSTSPYALSKIIYTECDEAPMLATYSLLPIIQRFAKPMGIEVSKTSLSPVSFK